MYVIDQDISVIYGFFCPSTRHLKLTAEQKCDIAQRELEELRDEIEKLKDESEKILDNFRVSLWHIKIS